MARKRWGLAAAEVCIKPVGGYRFVTSEELCLAWAAYREGRVTARGLRAYFALHEMAARRAAVAGGRIARFTVTELAALMDEDERKGRAALRELERAELVVFTERALRFNRAAALTSVPACLHTMLAEFKNPARAVPVPRRLLRLLAVRAGRGYVATALAHVLRCMRYLRTRGCVTTGLCHPRWTAKLFGVSLSAVKAARDVLETEGLLTRSETPRWVCRRFGSRMAVNPRWCEATDPKSDLSPAAADPKSGLPDSQPEPSSTSKNQKPAGRRPTGFHGNRQTLPAPRLQHVEPEDLRDLGRLEALYREACEKKLAQASESGFYDFVALAERAKRVGQNPSAVFASLLKRRAFNFIANEDEDAALRRVRQARDLWRREPREEATYRDAEQERRTELRRQLEEVLRQHPERVAS